jgi:hypothetical protein
MHRSKDHTTFLHPPTLSQRFLALFGAKRREEFIERPVAAIVPMKLAVVPLQKTAML